MFNRALCAVTGVLIGVWGWAGGGVTKVVVVPVYPIVTSAAAWLNQVGPEWIHLWVVGALLGGAIAGGVIAKVVGRTLGGGALLGFINTAVWGESGVTLNAGPFRLVLEPALDWAAKAAQLGYTAAHLRHPWGSLSGWTPSSGELVRAGLDEGFRMGERTGWNSLAAQADHAVAVYTQAERVLTMATSTPEPSLLWVGLDQTGSLAAFLLVWLLVKHSLMDYTPLPSHLIWVSQVLPTWVRLGESQIFTPQPGDLTWAGGWLKAPDWWVGWARSDAIRERKKWEARRAALEDDAAAPPAWEDLL